jgi:hypothetical protein
MQTTNLFIPREFFHLTKRNVDRHNRRQRPVVRIQSETTPEHRLWKLSMQSAFLRGFIGESIAFLFFGLLVGAAAVYCGTELFYVVNSGALEQTVQALLSSSGAPVSDLVH